MSVVVGDLLLRLHLDPESFNRDMERVKQQAVDAAKSIEREFSQKTRLEIKAYADDSDLTKLNKHLNLKDRHFDQVQRKIKNNPIKLKVDASEIANGNKQLNSLQQRASRPVSVNGFNNSIQETPSVKLDTSDFRKSLGEVQSAIEKTSRKSGVGDALLAPFKAVSGAMSKVVEGALFSIGAPVGEEIGEGIREGISKESSAIIGSFKLISREIASGLTQDIVNSLGTDAGKIKNAIAGIVGESNLVNEGAAVRGTISAQSRQRQNVAGRQISEEYQSLIGRSGEIQARESDLKSRRSDIVARSQELQKVINEHQKELGIDKLQQQVEESSQQLQQIIQQAQSSPENAEQLQQQAENIKSKISSAFEKISNLSQQVSSKFKEQIDELNAVNEDLAASEQQFERELEPLKQIDQIKPIKANRFGARKSSANNPEYYKAIFGEVVKQSGIDADRAVIPELVANPKLGSGVFGQYDPQTNQIQISEQALESVKAGNLAMKQIETLIHELRHAVQFDFGRVDAERENLPIALMRPSAEQLQQFSGNIERSTAHASSPETESRIRALEADAYSFADSAKDAIASSVSKSFSIAQFEKQFGIGGGKSLNAISVAQQQALMSLKKIKGLVDEYGVDVQSEISSTLKNIQSAGASIVPLLNRASDLDLLSPQEIQELSEGLLSSYTEAVEQINQQVDAFKQQALTKVKASQQPKQSAEEFKAGLNEQYSAAGLRQVAQRLGYTNAGKMKKSDLVELIGSSGATDVDKIIASLGDTIKKSAYRTGTGASLPKANEKAIAEQLKAANKRLQEMLKNLKVANDEARKQVVEQIVIETNKQIAEIDKLTKEQQLSGKGKQRVSGFRNYFEQVRSPLAAEMTATNAASINQMAKKTQGQGLAAFGDIREEVQKLFESFKGGAKIDPDLFYSPAAARVNKNLNKFGRAEQQINQRYEQAFSAPLQVGGSGSENTFTRVVRAVKSQIDAGLISRVTKFAGSLSSLVSGFLAFQGVQFVIGVFTQISQAVFETAIAFESLERRINFTSGSMSEGAKNISFLRNQAKDLGLDLKQTLEGGAGFIGAVQGTPLEGERSRKILGAVNQASAVYGLDSQQQERGLLALQQTASKGVVSQEEIRGQLAEAIPNAVAVASRAYGVNTQELNKMIKAGLDSTEFLDKFAQQLSAETSTGVAGAANSSQAAINKFNNSITGLQESVGKLMLPLRNLSLNAITAGLETLISLTPAIMAVIQFLIVKLTQPFWMPFAKGIAEAFQNIRTNGIKLEIDFKRTLESIKSSLGTITKAVAPLALEFAVFQLVSYWINSVRISFSDLSQEFGEAVRLMTNDLNKLDEALGKKQESKGWFDGDILKKMFPDLTGATEEIKTASDKVNAIFAGIGSTRDLIARSQSSEFSSQVSQIQQIDKQLEEVQIKRRALVQLNPQDSQGLKELQAQETELLKNREKAVAPIAIAQQGYKTRIDFLKKSLEELSDLRDKGGFIGRESQYDNAVKQVTEELKNAEKAQDDLNKKISIAATAFINLQKNIQRIADALADVGTNITTTTNAAKAALANGVASSTVTPGQEQYLSRNIDQQSLRKQAEAQASAIVQTSVLLNTDENKLRMKERGIDFNTGQARLKTLAESADANPEDKYLLEQMAGLQDSKLKLSDLKNQLAQSRAEAQRALVDQTKQVADYYRSIARQAEETQLEVKRLQNQIKTTTAQNKLRSALLSGFDDATSQFVDGLIDLMAQFSAIAEKQIEDQKQQLQTQNSLEDQTRQGIELSRSLPGQLPKIPVELDLSGIQNDANIEAVNAEIDNAAVSADNLKASVEHLERSWKLNNDAVQNFDSSISDANSTVSETYKQLEGINTSLDTTGETTKDWGSALTPVKDNLSNIGELLGNILKGIEGAIASTTQWLGGLVQGLQQAGQAFAPLTQGGIGQVAQGIGTAVGGAFGVSTEQVGQFFSPQSSDAGSKVAEKALRWVGKDFKKGVFARCADFVRSVLGDTGFDLNEIGVSKKPIDAGTQPNNGALMARSFFGKDIGQVFTDPKQARRGDIIGFRGTYGEFKGTQAISHVGVYTGNGMMVDRSTSSKPVRERSIDTFGKGNYVFVRPHAYGQGQNTQTNQVPGNSQSQQSLLSKNKLHSYQVRELDTGKIIDSQNANQRPASSASTLKLVVADLIVDAINQGKLKLDQSLKVQQSDISADSKMRAGTSISVADALQKMLRSSDNTSSNTLMTALNSVIGKENINKTIKERYPDSNLSEKFNMSGRRSYANQTTANDVSAAMVRLFKGDSTANKIAQNALLQTRKFGYNNEAGGKIGNNAKVVGNVGLAEVKGKKYVITGFVNQGDSPNARNKITGATNEIIGNIKNPRAAQTQTRSRQVQNNFTSGKYANTLNKLSPEFLAKAAQVSNSLGTSPENLLAVMGFETGGKFSPSIRNSLGYTGLIQFSPKYSPGNVGKTTNQLAKMSQVEQLNYVEKYINKNRQGKSVASLEDLYMSVLMPSHIGKGGNAKLPGWAYKANRGLDLDKDGAISITEATNKVRDYLPSSQVIKAANLGQAASPQAMQGTTAQGVSLAQSTGQQQLNAQSQLNEADRVRQDQEARRTFGRMERQRIQSSRDAQDQNIASQRNITDVRYGVNRNPSHEQQRLKNSTDIARKYDDQEKQAQRALEDAERSLKTSEEALANFDINNSNLPADIAQRAKENLQIKADENKQTVDIKRKELADLKKLREEDERSFTQHENRQEQLRRQSASFGVREGEIDELQSRINLIKEMGKINPSIPALDNLPDLEKTLALKQADLDLDKQLVEAEQKLYDDTWIQEEYDARTEAYKRANLAKQEEIGLIHQQRTAEQQLARARRALQNAELKTGVQNEILRSRSQLRDYGIGTSNKLELNREADLTDNALKYQEEMLYLQEMSAQGVTGKLKADRLHPLYDERNQMRVQGIEAKFKRDTEDDAIAAQERLFRSQQDLLSGRSSKLGRYGVGDRALEKEIAVNEQNFSYEAQMRELDRLAASGGKAAEVATQLKANLESLNQIKLQDIADQFNPLVEVANSSIQSFQGFFSSMITGSKSIGDAFRDLIGGIADNLANLAAQLITNEIFGSILGGGKKKGGGGIFGDLFGGLGGGGGILNLVSGLFYDGGVISNYASGGIVEAAKKEMMQSGRNPKLVMAHAGELMIPYDRTQQLAAIGLSPDYLLKGRLANYAEGGVVGDRVINLSGASTRGGTVINAPVTVTVNKDGSVDSKDDGSKFGNVLKNAIVSTIIKERRPGGQLYGV